MNHIALRHAARAAGAAALALCLAACGDRVTNTGPAGAPLRISLRASVMGGPNEALARVDSAHVKVSHENVLLLDTTMAYGAGGIDLAVRLPDPTGTVTVDLELTYRGQVLFRGGGSAELQRGSETRIPLTITPVVAGLAAASSVTLTALGDSLRLGGAAVFASGDSIPEAPLTWSGDGGGVIRVTANGLVTALREGQGQATLAYQSLSWITRVLVQAVVTRVTLSADTFSLYVDSTRTLAAVARDRSGNVLQRTFAWRSSAAGVATVDAGGVVKAVAQGTATITATSEAQSASATVTVRRIPVASVQVAPANVALAVGGTAVLSATTYDARGAVLTGRTVSWSSSNPQVATVDSTGLVRGVSTGLATVVATSEGKSGSASVRVGLPVIAVSQSTVVLNAIAASGPTTQQLSVTNAGSGTLSGLSATVSYPLAGPSGWLGASLDGTTAPATLTLSATPGSLAAGTYSATVIVASSIQGVTAVQVTVQLVVYPSLPIIAASSTSVTLHMRVDTVGAPVSTTLSVYNSGGGTLDGLYLMLPDVSWLNASLSSTTAPATLTVTAHGFVSANASYTDTITIASTVPGIASKTITVTYTY